MPKGLGHVSVGQEFWMDLGCASEPCRAQTHMHVCMGAQACLGDSGLWGWGRGSGEQQSWRRRGGAWKDPSPRRVLVPDWGPPSPRLASRAWRCLPREGRASV